jgi:hypothetical protein
VSYLLTSLNRPAAFTSLIFMCSALIVYPVLDEPSFRSAANFFSLSPGKMNNSGRALSLHKGAEAFRLFHIVPIQTMRLIAQTATGKESHIHWTLRNTVLLYLSSCNIWRVGPVERHRCIAHCSSPRFRSQQRDSAFVRFLKLYIALPISLNTHAKLSSGVLQVSFACSAENIAWTRFTKDHTTAIPTSNSNTTFRRGDNETVYLDYAAGKISCQCGNWQ